MIGMVQTFFWYDLETSSISPRDGRVMQFAGQRTNLDLELVGEPVNVLIKLSEDILPEPEAILVTGITPQSTIQDGITEVEFMKLFSAEVAIPGTIFVGYNTVRFDDEFMRFMHYRNFYDAYEWEWKEGRSRWDLLDLVRTTRALRPDGINWPMTDDGKPTNRLELLTKANGLDHENAHDALNDVIASIAVARLIHDKQPKLFDWLLNMRDKKDVKKFLHANQTCIYTSGKYANETEKTSAVRVLHTDDSKGSIVYDLRHDPTEFLNMTAEQLADRWRYNREPDAPARLPVKSIKYNRCPALSPMGILSDKAVQERLKVTPGLIEKHLGILSGSPEFSMNVVKARDLMDVERAEQWGNEEQDVDVALYGGDFFGAGDKRLMDVVRATDPDELTSVASDFTDERLNKLVPRYKARNYPSKLTDEERKEWEAYRHHVLLDGGNDSRMAKYMKRLTDLLESNTDKDKKYLLEELQLYAESILPVIDSED